MTFNYIALHKPRSVGQSRIHEDESKYMLPTCKVRGSSAFRKSKKLTACAAASANRYWKSPSIFNCIIHCQTGTSQKWPPMLHHAWTKCYVLWIVQHNKLWNLGAYTCIAATAFQKNTKNYTAEQYLETRKWNDLFQSEEAFQLCCVTCQPYFNLTRHFPQCTCTCRPCWCSNLDHRTINNCFQQTNSIQKIMITLLEHRTRSGCRYRGPKFDFFHAKNRSWSMEATTWEFTKNLKVEAQLASGGAPGSWTFCVESKSTGMMFGAAISQICTCSSNAV